MASQGRPASLAKAGGAANASQKTPAHFRAPDAFRPHPPGSASHHSPPSWGTRTRRHASSPPTSTAARSSSPRWASSAATHPHPGPEPEPDPSLRPSPEPQPKTEPEPQPEPKPEAKPHPKPEPGPTQVASGGGGQNSGLVLVFSQVCMAATTPLMHAAHMHMQRALHAVRRVPVAAHLPEAVTLSQPKSQP